ncbi:MAG: general secretion pathway protein GspK [Sedimentisphaerales bacterium]|nr:general secretion pathway protein GspK [Sedimentisphaerales bacterium]
MKTNSKNKGLVLVGVLWIVIILTAIVAVLGRKSRLDSKIVLGRSETIRTKWACRAGIERAVALLNEDEKDSDCINDIWAYSPEDLNDFEMAGCYYNVIITDESGKLDINTLSWEQFMGLPGMYEDIADAIIDWRDSDEDVSEMGTEYGYYENLTYGYQIRNAPFRTIRELLLVKGVTDEMFYGEDTNLNGKLDYNEMDGDANPPYDNGDLFLDQGWAAYITCYTSDANSTTTETTETGQNTNSNAIITYASNNSQSTIQTAQNSSSSTISAIANQGGQTQTGQTQTGQTQTDQTQTDQTAQTNQTTDTTQQTTEETGTLMVNVNTASEVVLAALMGGGDDAYIAAQAIIAYRNNLEYGIEDVSELSSQGIISSDMLSMIQDYLTVSSNIYKISCIATANRGGVAGTQLKTEVVIDRSTSPYKVLYWYQGASK